MNNLEIRTRLNARWASFLLLLGAIGLSTPSCTTPAGPVDDNNGAYDCGVGRALCGSTCVDVGSNLQHCGQCNHSCGSEDKCSSGSCVPECQVDQTDCSGSCIPTANFQTDRNNCGSCDHACAPGNVCSEGVCSCPAGIDCGPAETGGSSNATGGSPSGGQTTGGSGPTTTGGSESGGDGSGGIGSEPGGAGTGGTGGSDTGGAAGSDTGGAAGSDTGGAASGGTGGIGTGGTETGGSSTGGSASGGSASGGGGSGGQPATGGMGGAGPSPRGGYLESGSWHGYAWSFATSNGTVSPENFDDVSSFPLCASGSVAASTNDAVLVGWNVNQDETSEDIDVVVPDKDGIYVAIENSDTRGLRLQILGPEEDSPIWCAEIPAQGRFVPYDDFNTRCWDPSSGVDYAGEEFSEVMVAVPGGPTKRDFDFCIELIHEAHDAPGNNCTLRDDPGVGTHLLTGSGPSSYAEVERDGRYYLVHNNVRASAPENQSLQVSGTSFQITEQSNTATISRRGASFPSVFVGSAYGRSSPGSGLPRLVEDLSALPVAWSWTEKSDVGDDTYSAAFDLWFSTEPQGDASTPSGGYLMLWFKVPTYLIPPATNDEVTVLSTEIGGRDWAVWICDDSCARNGVPVISYSPALGEEHPIQSWDFDLFDFVEDAVSRGVVDESWYLTQIAAGFEVWDGGVDVKTNEFCAIVQ